MNSFKPCTLLYAYMLVTIAAAYLLSLMSLPSVIDSYTLLEPTKSGFSRHYHYQLARNRLSLSPFQLRLYIVCAR